MAAIVKATGSGERDALPGPLTHEAYAAACRDQAARRGLALSASGKLVDRSGQSPTGLFVQVRRQGAVLCGQALSCHRMPGPGGGELFRVDTAVGLGWFPPSAVRLCSGDGRCVCEAA